jgi:hypothetical protein
VYERLSAPAILTADHHLSQMGARTIRNVDIQFLLRDYSRAASAELSLKVNGLLCGIVCFEVVRRLPDTIVAIWNGFLKLPIEIRVLVGVGVAALLLHDGSRDRLKGFFKRLVSQIGNAGEALLPVFAELQQEAKRAGEQRRIAERRIAELLPLRSSTLSSEVLALVMSKTGPVSEDQIVGLLGKSGVITSGPNFRRRLRTALRSHPELRQVAPSHWQPASVET